MFMSLYSSMKSYLGFEDANLELASGGQNEDAVKNANTEERKSLWQQLKNHIGSDITSSISLPIWIFEPLSFLQIICEPMQYAELLEKASVEDDPYKRLAYVIAFIMAGYSQATRTRKPFNPFLGETFEFTTDRFKFYAEQVSHHPPISAGVVESENYRLELEMGLKTKFRGNSTEVIVTGPCKLHFLKYGDVISWGHLRTFAYNIIIGGMWIDHFGTLEIVNETNKAKAVLNVTQAGWLGIGRWKTEATIYDSKDTPKYVVNGMWNESLYCAPADDEENSELIWKRVTEISNSKWGWCGDFNDQMNKLEGLENVIPPTDSRLRTDRLSLERGDLEVAGREKSRLEEEQRTLRKKRQQSNQTWVQRFFKYDEQQGRWVSLNNYWQTRSNKTEK